MDNPSKELIDYLFGFVTEARKALFLDKVQQRTEHLRVVLENIYQTQNASAVLRSADAFGIQNIDVIESRNRFNVHTDISIGADKWLDIHSHSNTKECLSKLKKQGYQIVATSLNEQSVNIDAFDFSKKTALVFGTELTGITTCVKDMADGFVKIPMVGFSESFNISVAAALCMYIAKNNISSKEIPFELSEKRKHDVLLEWLRKSVKNSSLLEENYLNSRSNYV